MKITTMAAVVKAARRAEEKRKLADIISQSQVAQLWREKNYTVLGAHMAYHSIKGLDNVETVAEVETRDRHSLVSLAAPNEVDEEDERHLRDEQVSQIFFNCLVTELFVAATFNETSTVTAPICVKNMTHPRWLPFGTRARTLTRPRPPNLSNRARARALTRAARNLARARALVPSTSPRPNPKQGGCPTRPSTT